MPKEKSTKIKTIKKTGKGSGRPKKIDSKENKVSKVKKKVVTKVKKTTKKSAVKKSVAIKPVVNKVVIKPTVVKPKIRINRIKHDNVDKDSVVDLKKEFGDDNDLLSKMIKDQSKQGRKEKVVEKIKESRIGQSIKNVELGEKIKESKKIPIKVYKKMAFSFVAFAVILLLVIMYFSLVKTSIVINLKEEGVSDSIVIDVYDRSEDYVIPDLAVRGLVKAIDLEQSKIYEVSGNEVLGEEVIGRITIYNKRSRKQQLVATTRFLSSEGKLFRLKAYVEVPAEGQIDVDVYADDPIKENVVGADRFIIPGLPAVWQDQVYAESEDGSIEYREKLKRVITEQDIADAKEDIKNTLIEKAKIDINETYSEYDKKVYQINDESIVFNVNGEIDDERDSFSVNVSATVVVVAFDDGEVKRLSENKINIALPVNKQITSLDKENFSYDIALVDLEKSTSKIDINFAGKTNLKTGFQIVDKNKIVNLSKSQLEHYLESLPWVGGYEIKFQPAFLERTPILVDRIKVEVE